MFWNFSACRHRVTSVTTDTETVGWMMYNFTFGIEAASTTTWINTFIVYTSFMPRTVGILNTFGSATQVWVTEVPYQTCAWSSTMQFFTYGIRATRWGHTWFGWSGWYNNWNYSYSHICTMVDLYTPLDSAIPNPNNQQVKQNLTWSQTARWEWISLVARQTWAHWLMVDDRALSIESAGSYAWVSTFVIQTGQLGGTVSVNQAFGPTVRWHTQHAYHTTAHRPAIDSLTLGIRSTRWWTARVQRNWRWFWF